MAWIPPAGPTPAHIGDCRTPLASRPRGCCVHPRDRFQLRVLNGQKLFVKGERMCPGRERTTSARRNQMSFLASVLPLGSADVTIFG